MTTMQPPRNYTTTIPVARTLGEVMALLADAGAEQIVTKYGPDRQPAGIAFALRTPDGPAGYRLEVDAGHILARMDSWYFNGHTKAGKPTKEQAQRVAWRTLQDWLEAQVELIRNGLAPLDQVMLPWRVVDGSGTTMYRALAARQFALPPAGGDR